MATFFSIIRFVPSAVTNETINVGLLLASGNRLEVRSLDDWHRVKAFAGSSSSARDVRRVISDMADDPARFLGINAVKSAEQLRECLSAWTRVIQFSDVRASLAPIEELAATLHPMILGESSEELTQNGRRAAVLRAVHQAVVSAYELRFSRKPRGMIQKQAVVNGKKTRHKIDVGIVNGRFYAGAFALSFASAQTEKQWKDTDAVAFALEDMAVDRDTVAVVLDPPADRTEPYDRAQALFQQLQVPIVAFDKISEWANQAVMHVPESAAH